VTRTLLALAEALVDEGIDDALSFIAGIGVDGLAVTATYHQGRYMLPRGRRKVAFLQGDAAFFRPAEGRYGAAPAPRVADLRGPGDVLAEILARGAAHGLAVDAWAVFLHNVTLGSARPDLVARNAFGDAYLTDLCPANPVVRQYAVGLGADVAARGVRAVLAESLHFHRLGHGYHHELNVPLPAVEQFLFGLCFCQHCLAAAAARGVDGDRCRRAVAAVLQEALERAAPPAETPDLQAEIGSVADGELDGYLSSRAHSVTTLVAAVGEAVRAEGSRLALVDPMGAVLGYATGEPAGPLASSRGWQLGLDLAAVAPHLDRLLYLGYVRDLDRLGAEIEGYQAVVPGPLGVVLRPGLPDRDSGAAVTAAARVVERLVDGLYVYAYGPLRTFELERLAALPAPPNRPGHGTGKGTS
jgi:hypothetical protein